jgi:outer membrane protein insertion porin family
MELIYLSPRPSNKRERLLLRVALLLLIGASRLQAQTPLEDMQFKTVGEVEIKADGEVDQPFLLSLIKITPGADKVTIPAIRDAIKLLYDTGNFTNILVDATPVNDNARLTFILRLVYRFQYIHLKGNLGLSTYVINRGVRLRKLEPYTPEKVLRGREDIIGILQENGYYRATVIPDVLLHRSTKQAEVTYAIDAGQRAVVGSIVFTGDAFFSTANLLKLIKSPPGSRFKEADIKRDLDRIEAFYDKNGFLEHQVQFAKQDLDDSNQMNLTINIQAGKRLVLRIDGTQIPEKALHENLPLWSENNYNDDTLEDGKRNLIAYMQKQGYYEATVEWQKNLSGEQNIIVYEVDPGPRYEVDKILISGNEHLPVAEIKAAIQTKESGMVKSQRLVTTVFEGDKGRILSAYHEHGFLFARFVKDEVQTLPAGRINLDLQIDEGPQSIVSEIRLNGNHSVSREEFLQKFLQKTGKPISESNAKTDSNLIVALYSDRGYPKVQVRAKLQLSQDKKRALILYDITEGEQILVDRIVISGNYRTRRNLILENLYFADHDPLSLRKIAESQARLYSLQIFDRAEIEVPRPDSMTPQQKVLVRLTETKPYTISYGIGYQTYDLFRGVFNISDRNLFGTGRGLAFQLRGGIREARSILTYSDTHLLFHNLNSSLNLLAEKRVLRASRPKLAYREYSAFFQTEKRLSKEAGQLPVGVPIPPLKSLFFRYRFSDITNKGTPTLEPDVRPYLPIHISSVAGGYARDARDNAIDPTRGNYLTSSLEWATYYLGSQTDYLKNFSEFQYYVPFRKLVLASALRVGLSKGLRDTNNLPISQRFFAGGCSTIRGFEQDSCGPVNATGEVVGGNDMLIANLETRFPVYGNVGGVVFFDFGNVFKKIRNLTQLGKMRESAGLGIRYKTPIGPLSIDWGYKLDRNPGESPYEFCFAVGNAF